MIDPATAKVIAAHVVLLRPDWRADWTAQTITKCWPDAHPATVLTALVLATQDKRVRTPKGIGATTQELKTYLTGRKPGGNHIINPCACGRGTKLAYANHCQKCEVEKANSKSVAHQADNYVNNVIPLRKRKTA